MRFRGIDFVTISSNNHASPTGALPFLLPASSSTNPREAVLPIPSTRIDRWIREKKISKRMTVKSSEGAWEERNQHTEGPASTQQESTPKESLDIRYEAYMSLLNYRIRNAYVGLLPPYSINDYLIFLCFSSVRFTFLPQTSHPSSFPSISTPILQTPLPDSRFPINYAPQPKLSFSSNHQCSM